MGAALRKIPFSADLLPEVEDFECGHEIYQIAISNWIKNVGADGVIGCMRRWGTKVWLYVTSEGDLVGYGSVGSTKWNWPSASDGKVVVGLIPCMGVDRRFWHQPDGVWQQRYSAQIVLDLVAEAKKLPGIRPLLGLFVHPCNKNAIQLYSRIGFVDFYQRSKGADPNVEYMGMILALEDPIPRSVESPRVVGEQSAS